MWHHFCENKQRRLNKGHGASRRGIFYASARMRSLDGETGNRKVGGATDELLIILINTSFVKF